MKTTIFLALLKRKNKQIRLERERCRAMEETNKIISAYVGLLVAKCGVVEFPKALLADAIGKFSVSVCQNDGYYKINVTEMSNETVALAKESIKTLEG